MSKPNNGGPAFPRHDRHIQWGMSLRDYFAGHALGGVIANSAIVGQLEREDGDAAKQFAEFAYVIADAMIAESSR